METRSRPRRVATPALQRGLDPDAQVVRAAQAGGRAALETLTQNLVPAVRRTVRALMGESHPDNDDLVQEVLVAVLAALPSFRGESTLLHFANRIATRIATRARRRSRSIVGWHARFAAREQPLAVNAASPHDLALAERHRTALRALLAELPGAQAEALVLRAVEGHSVAEVSAITASPINTVRSRLRLAKQALRRGIARDADEPS